jgi:hypothetical protein
MVRKRLEFDYTGGWRKMCLIRKERIEPSPRKWEKFLAPVSQVILGPIFFSALDRGSLLLRNVCVYLDTSRVSKASRLQYEDNLYSC